jgi:hypothetical protein
VLEIVAKPVPTGEKVLSGAEVNPDGRVKVGEPLIALVEPKTNRIAKKIVLPTTLYLAVIVPLPRVKLLVVGV